MKGDRENIFRRGERCEADRLSGPVFCFLISCESSVFCKRILASALMAIKKSKSARGAKKKPPLMDIRTVAERANVSIATVSRTINHVPTVNAKMAKRVWEAIRELNYFPNTQARALVSGRTRLLGLIVSEITNPFFPELIQGF